MPTSCGENLCWFTEESSQAQGQCVYMHTLILSPNLYPVQVMKISSLIAQLYPKAHQVGTLLFLATEPKLAWYFGMRLSLDYSHLPTRQAQCS